MINKTMAVPWLKARMPSLTLSAGVDAANAAGTKRESTVRASNDEDVCAAMCVCVKYVG